MTADDAELVYAGPGELARRVGAGEVHPRELVAASLRRIEALDPQLRAFRTVLAEEATAAAERPAAGPLAGVPVAVKDDTAIAGQATTLGSRTPAAARPADGEVVRRLRAAGAIPIGITAVPELMIFPWTASDAHGTTRNPWDTSRTPGGSSGGSAAAVAAGLVPVATGSDGAGSIRIPAACCGLVGLKPSRGRVSTAPAAEGWLGLSTFGALTRTVADAALLLDVLAGTTAVDRDRIEAPGRPFAEAAAAPPGPMRVAVSRRVPPGVLARLGADQGAALDRTAARLAELGHRVVERDPAYGSAGVAVLRAYLGGIAADADALGPGAALERSTRQMAAAGRLLVRPSQRHDLRRRWRGPAARLLALWDDVDVLLTPALAGPPLPAEGGWGRSAPAAFAMAASFTPWTAAWNLTGQPALALPAGTDGAGLPLAVQLVGAPGREDQLLSLAAQLEAAEPWAARRPSVS